MACTIDDTVGGATANAYIDIADADDYFDNHTAPTTWDDAAEDDKCRALQTATRMLDASFEWVGSVASSTQALLWPRDSAYGPNGFLHTTDEIPQRIREATAELAQQLLASNRMADADAETQGIKRLRVGSGLEIEFKASVTAKPIPDYVVTLIGDYGRHRSKYSGAITMLRG
jgi:hypothetical protein